VRLLGGLVDPHDTALLVSLLPSLVHVRRRTALRARHRRQEASERQRGRGLMLARLVDGPAD
jgi:hypothetical protein